MMAETIGIFMESEGTSPLRYFTRGVFKETFAGVHSEDEYPGIRRYSLKVCEGSLMILAIFDLPPI